MRAGDAHHGEPGGRGCAEVTAFTLTRLLHRPRLVGSRGRGPFLFSQQYTAARAGGAAVRLNRLRPGSTFTFDPAYGLARTELRATRDSASNGIMQSSGLRFGFALLQPARLHIRITMAPSLTQFGVGFGVRCP
jgi:hypothetical protein